MNIVDKDVGCVERRSRRQTERERDWVGRKKVDSLAAFWGSSPLGAITIGPAAAQTSPPTNPT